MLYTFSKLSTEPSFQKVKAALDGSVNQIEVAARHFIKDLCEFTTKIPKRNQKLMYAEYYLYDWLKSFSGMYQSRGDLLYALFKQGGQMLWNKIWGPSHTYYVYVQMSTNFGKVIYFKDNLFMVAKV